MYRQILGYIPSNIIPAIISTLAIYAYTRLLSPAAFGAYSYIFAATLVLQSSLFFAVPIVVMRFYPAAVREDRRDGLLKAAYLIFLCLAVAVSVPALFACLLVPMPPAYALAAWLAVPMLLARALVQLNQAVNRSANAMARYNLIECLHAVLGLAFGLGALFFLGHGADAIVAGLLLAAVVCALIDVPWLVAALRRHVGMLDRKHLISLIEYAWPIVAVATSSMVLVNGDRFLLGSISGAEVLGVFAVAYNLVERPTTIICTAVSPATFPLVVQVLEHQGKEAARRQAGRNGIALLAVALPACAGLAMTADYIAATLVGPAFRSGVAALIPIMSFTALARGLRSHFVDHAFHLSGKPLMMLWTYGPATLLNIAANLVVIPRYGMFGAAWTAFACQGAAVIGGWFIGTSLFPVWLPFWQVVRCVAAVALMVAALAFIRFPLDWAGLAAAIVVGSVIYGVSALLLDVGEVRTLGVAALRGRVRRRAPVLME